MSPEPAAMTHQRTHTANQRFKRGSSNRTGVGLLCAVALHLTILLLVQPFEVADLAAAEDGDLRVVIPEVRLPEPPPDIPRPSLPIMGDLTIDPTVTVAPTEFDYLDLLPPPPSPVANDSSQVRFIPYDTPPQLRNGEEIARVLRREYPSGLRRAGVEGRVLLWMYVDETGLVTRTEVKQSSGSPALDDAALRVADRMRFRPATNRDRKTAVWVQQWVSFRIR